MYYSKNNSSNITLPRNYSGNTFRVIDESERHYTKEDPEEQIEKSKNLSTKIEEKEIKKMAKAQFYHQFSVIFQSKMFSCSALCS